MILIRKGGVVKLNLNLAVTRECGDSGKREQAGEPTSGSSSPPEKADKRVIASSRSWISPPFLCLTPMFLSKCLREQ